MGSREAIVGGPTGGIPLSVFRPGFHGRISGTADLEGTTTRDKISITSMVNSAYIFEAEMINPTLMTFIVNNKGRPGDKRHPKLYPKQLITQAHEYFTDQGYDIKGVQVTWFDDATGRARDLYEQYMTYLSGLGDRPITEADKREAAKNNWAGQVLKELGFTGVDDIHEVQVGGKTFSVIVTFKKSTPQLHS